MEVKELDFLKLPSQDWNKEFKRIATDLFCKYSIRANEKTYNILEIEFYYDAPDENHPDHFIYDKTDRNKSIGNWFFHYSGIDLTFGQNGTRGGILIRAIKEGEPFTIGPLRTMVALMNEFPSLTSGKDFPLKLSPKTPASVELVDQPLVRKGLDKTKSIDFPVDAARKYRFTYNRKAMKLTDSQYEQYFGERRSG